MKTSELFEKELKLIKNKHMRKIVAKTLDASPECIQTIPASSSGKYHPTYSLGMGGLVRHIKSTVGIAWSMIESDVLKGMLQSVLAMNMAYEDIKDSDYDLYNDVAYASLILHDCCKPDDTEKHHTRFDHPLVGAKLFEETTIKYLKNKKLSDKDVEYFRYAAPLVSKCIQCHMGKYTTSKYSDVVLPKPRNVLEWFVHSCDLLSSKKYIEFDFDKYYESLK